MKIVKKLVQSMSCDSWSLASHRLAKMINNIR